MESPQILSTKTRLTPVTFRKLLLGSLFLQDQSAQKDLKSAPLPASPVAAPPDAMPTAAAPVAVVPVAVPLLPSKQIQEAPGASIRLPTGIIISAVSKSRPLSAFSSAQSIRGDRRVCVILYFWFSD